jgi:predicted ATPase
MAIIEVHPPTLSRLRVNNYRSLADVDMTFGPLTVLVGSNGAGKSNLVDVLRFVRDATTRGLDDAIIERGGMSAIRRWSAKGAPYDIHIQLECSGTDSRKRNWLGEYSFTLGRKRRGGYRVKQERYSVTGKGPTPMTLETRDGRWVQLPADDGRYLPDELFHISDTTLDLLGIGRLFGGIYTDMIHELFRNMGFYTIYPDILREPQKPAHSHPLDEKGRNLASVLRDLQSPQTSDLLRALGKVVPRVHDYSVTPVGGYLVTRLRHKPIKQGSRGPSFELAQESDGTLRMLGILTALYQDPPRSLLTIEEPELTIHPGALGVLRDVLQEGSLRSQVIVTTHSPDLISDLPADVLRVVEKKDGMTQVGPISEMQREAIAEMLFSPGELMRMEGLRRDSSESPEE